MAGKAKSSVAKHRARMERQGLVRVEVSVRKEDASLVRGLLRPCRIPRAGPRRACFCGNVSSSHPRPA